MSYQTILKKNVEEPGYQNIELQGISYIIGLKYLHDNSPIYVVFENDEDWEQLSEISHEITTYILDTASPLLFVLSLSLIFAFFFITWMVLHFLRPLGKLELWVRNLSASNMHDAIPDFSFKELNTVAIPFQQSFINMENIVSKEQFLLKTTSHELRTPIAVAGMNVELLKRYLSQLIISDDCQETVHRIERAIKDMKKLTETVLWLGYENSEPFPEQPIALDSIITDIITDNYHLVEGKDVDINLSLTPCVVTLPITPCQMAISNVIRNAMQYTQAGYVLVELTNGKVTIKNEDSFDSSYDKSSSDYGFGLGLILVERICSLMHWHYTNQEISGGRLVKIDFLVNT